MRRWLEAVVFFLFFFFIGSIFSFSVYAGTSSIVGKVVKSDGLTALESAEIMVHTSNWSVSQWTTSNSDGEFSFTGLDAGTYIMEFRTPWNSQGLVPPDPVTSIVADGATFYRNGADGTDCSGSPCSAIQFSAANNTISGTVKKSNNSAVSGAYVEAYKEMGMGWVQTTTDSNGQYSLKVGSGTWIVQPRANYGADPSAVDWTYNKMGTRVSFTNNNSPGTTTTTNFTVQTADCLVTGTVKDPDGNALSNPQSSVYVSIWSYNGGGNGANVDSNGAFSLKVPEGTYNLGVSTWASNYGSPADTKITLQDADSNGSCDGYAAGTIKLVSKNSTILGTVKDSNGTTVANQSVNAWKQNGGGWSSATTDSNGNYSMAVSAGTWMVSLSVDPGMYGSGYGGGTAYVYDQSPVQITIAANTTSSSNNFTLKIANATISGRVVDSSSNTLTELEMGYAYVESGTSGGSGPMMYSTMGAPVKDGTFTLKVPAGTYNVGVSLPSGAGYCGGSSTSVAATANATSSATITLTSASSTISGYLKKDSDSGDTITGVKAEIFANSGTMNYAMGTVNESDGSYSLSVCPGDWYMGYWIDPSLTDGDSNSYLRQPPSNNKVTAVASATVTKNIIVKKADATISGTITDPDGAAFSGVWVSVDTRSNDTAGSFDRGSWFTNGAMSDSTGAYSVKVPSGVAYNVGAYLPGSYSYINPKQVSVNPATGATATVNLQFKNADATVGGTVSQGGAGISAFVSAWSEDGGYSSTTSNSDGSYSLSVTSGVNWHIKAMYESGTTFYRSNESVVSPTSGSNSLNLDLSNSGTMPDATTTTYSATNQKTITLSDGTTITIPAGALASSGNVTVSVSPKAQLPNQNLATPVNIGYDIKAYDSNGSEITSTFNSNVTIVMPYSESDLAALGITESDLLAGYWDSSTNSWRTADNISIDTDNNTITVTINHFTEFAPFAAGVKSSSSTSSTSTTSGENKTGGSAWPEIYAQEGAVITKDQIIVITEPGTLPWDSYVSLVVYRKKHPYNFSLYWQVSDVFELWYRSFFNKAKILSPDKPSIVAIRYNKSQLGGLPENSLKIAQSLNEGKTWRILPVSVTDKKNGTIATLSVMRGQYMLVSGYIGRGKADVEVKDINITSTTPSPSPTKIIKQAVPDTTENTTSSPKKSLWQRILDFVF